MLTKNDRSWLLRATVFLVVSFGAFLGSWAFLRSNLTAFYSLQLNAEPEPSLAPPMESSSDPSSTNIPDPTPTATTLPPTEKVDVCMRWDSISSDDAGTTLCVYGTVVDITFDEDASYVLIGDLSIGVYFVHYGDGLENIALGQCIEARGEIELLGQDPVLVVETGQVVGCKDSLMSGLVLGLAGHCRRSI